MKSFEQQTAEAIRTLQAWSAVLSVAFIIALGLAIYGLARLTGDEHRTCQIQAQALPAGHQLSVSEQDIYSLLTVKPTTRAERLAKAEESPQVRQIIADLTSHLAKYRADEAQQPHGRTC